MSEFIPLVDIKKNYLTIKSGAIQVIDKTALYWVLR